MSQQEELNFPIQQCCQAQEIQQPFEINQQVMTGMSVDPQSGQTVYTYSRPNIGGGKFSRESIDISVEPLNSSKTKTSSSSSSCSIYRVVVKPHSKKVLTGISAVKVFDHKSQKVLASVEDFDSRTHPKDCMDMDLNSIQGVSEIEVHVEWKCNTMDIWPPTLKQVLKVDAHKKVSSVAKVQ